MTPGPSLRSPPTRGRRASRRRCASQWRRSKYRARWGLVIAENGVMTTIKRVLVANRGEIALRIIRACHEEGLEAVAVYSDADRLSPHVRAANAAVPIGPPPASESYLNIPKLIAAAKDSGCQAVHPGYGFLSEREAFARTVQDAGLIFVGPPPAAIKAMGDKTEARRRMQAAGIPVVPGTAAPVRDAAEARREAQRLGLPVLLKPASGGGGKGMRLVRSLDEIESALRGAPSEAEKAFGTGAGVTELVYGVDRVRGQLRIAGGEPMRIRGGVSWEPRGHAIECRITAEDPANGFLPASGKVEYLRVPAGPGIRWDGGVEAGNDVTLFYDPLLAKLLAWGETREMAIRRMRRALRELVIVGLPTSQSFHLWVMDDPEFRRGEIDITYLERVGARLLAAPPPDDLVQAVAVAAAMLADDRRSQARVVAPSDPSLREGAVRPSAWLEAARREGLRS